MSSENKVLINLLGFPIFIENAPVLNLNGSIIYDINYQQLGKEAIARLIFKPYKLTGAELKFIRLELDLTAVVFSKEFFPKLTVEELKKLEKQRDKSALSDEKEESFRKAILLTLGDTRLITPKNFLAIHQGSNITHPSLYIEVYSFDAGGLLMTRNFY